MLKIGGTASVAIVLTGITIVVFGPLEAATTVLLLIVYVGMLSGAVAVAGSWMRARRERAQPPSAEIESGQ